MNRSAVMLNLVVRLESALEAAEAETADMAGQIQTLTVRNQGLEARVKELEASLPPTPPADPAAAPDPAAPSAAVPPPEGAIQEG